MKPIRTFTVRAVVPESLQALEELAANLRWSWHLPVKRLFERIDPALWREVGEDPIALLGDVQPSRLAELAADGSFVADAEAQRDELRRYLGEPRWYQQRDEPGPASIGYFSPEFGIAQALPQYSGGLGILAGDHLKAASDLGLPLIGVGLFYKAGYFAQAISRDGWQLESYPVLDPDGLPLTVLREGETPVEIGLDLPDGRVLKARVWQAAVGRVTLLLLDTDVPENDDDLRAVTDRLYGGGGEHRLLQELLLGVGGIRALAALARVAGTPTPEVYHMNEGHAGFLGLERIRRRLEQGIDWGTALELVRAGTVFTTHTPVPAGIDRFERDLVARYLPTVLPGIPAAQALALGTEPGDTDGTGAFNMAIMGLRLAGHANGVAKLHGQVSRRMFGDLWPGFDPDEVPITSVTNGVHGPSWIDPAMVDLAERSFGSTDTEHVPWGEHNVNGGELWSVKRAMRANLVDDARRRLAASWAEQRPGSIVPDWVLNALDPDVLTVGFARRVPTYKRLTLMLEDPERFERILTDPDRPVQFVIAGKSHPADDAGKHLIQQLVKFTEKPELRGKIVFLPDYDIGMAKVLYPGCDVWLNNPLRPLEACGTSGMKAAMNGALNLSILDGWWAEFSDGENGWAIPSADAAGDGDERDRIEAAALYDLLEHRVAPAFYDRGADGLPGEWLGMVRHTLATLSADLGADRMVAEYTERLYAPAAAQADAVAAADGGAAGELAAWKAKVRAAWPAVHVVHVESAGVAAVPYLGDTLHVGAIVDLGELSPDDVRVEVVSGRTKGGAELTDVSRQELVAAPGDEGQYRYSAEVALERAGRIGYTVRVLPRHALLTSSAELGLVAVAG
ncbi:alpha-glucan family phosphorylase [Agromyces seonyuensis]|uniref:glycogen phosphorylase n=1 Tax=Agromyces seonyuensis TaxID=2662446 RepID=A0A6I4NWI0_9MICO|nr:alpha-glucan family phosphorylase [Agromyces seonyuensis]